MPVRRVAHIRHPSPCLSPPHPRRRPDARRLQAAAWCLLAAVVALASSAFAADREITVLMRTPTLERAGLMERLAAEFEAIHPGTKVNVITGHEEEAIAMAAGGVPPNFWHQGLDTFEDWVARGGLEPIDYLYEADNFRLEDHFVGPAVAAVRSGGRTYAFPANINVDVLYYNTEMFARAGLAPPPSTWDDPAWTWDAFREAARKLSRDNDGDGDIDVYAMGFRNMLAIAFGRIFGGEWIVDNQFNGYAPEVRRAIEWIDEVINVDRSIPQPAVAGQYRFERGQTAMRWFHSGGFATFGDVDFEWDIAALPAGTIPWRFSHVNTFKFVAGAESHDVAYQFAKFIQTDPVRAAEFADAYGGFPSHRESLVQYLNERLTERRRDVLLGAIERLVPWGYGQRNNEAVYDVINRAVNDILNQQTHIEAGLESMRAEVNALLAAAP